MSRTKHHKGQKHRHGGHDLWSRRPCAGWPYCASSKRITIRRERARERKDIQTEIKLSDSEGMVMSKKRGPVEIPLEDRFWGKVKKMGENDCWEWQGCRNAAGYGRINVPRAIGTLLAHRVSWKMVYGNIPDGLCILHKCDNPRCVNVNHLFIGTYLDNVTDMISKGREKDKDDVLVGEESPSSILTEAAVRDIRNNPKAPRAVMAEKYGVCISTIKAAKNRQNWSHVK